MNTAAIRTAARIARFSIVKPAAHEPAADHIRGDGAGRGCVARRPEPAGSRQIRRGAARPSNARVRSWTAGQFACPAGRALEIQRRWSTVRVEETGRSDGQPFPPLRAPTLENFPSALGLHPLAKAVRFLPSPHVRLKRPLHEPYSPQDRESTKCRQRPEASQLAVALRRLLRRDSPSC